MVCDILCVTSSFGIFADKKKGFAMATTTTNLRLVKPSYADVADIEVINGNMDILDRAYKGLTDKDSEQAGQISELQSQISTAGTVKSISVGAALEIDGGGPITDTGTILHSNYGSAGTTGTQDATSGPTLDVPWVTHNAQGHITVSGTHRHTITGPIINSFCQSSSFSATVDKLHGEDREGVTPIFHPVYLNGPTDEYIPDDYVVSGEDVYIPNRASYINIKSKGIYRISASLYIRTFASPEFKVHAGTYVFMNRLDEFNVSRSQEVMGVLVDRNKNIELSSAVPTGPRIVKLDAGTHLWLAARVIGTNSQPGETTYCAELFCDNRMTYLLVERVA